jgi:hypothetical protein
VPVESGSVYFKAPAPAYLFEAQLTTALARWRPDCTVPVVAVELEQGWILSTDAGVTLRSRGQTPEQLDHWMKVLPLYSQFQIDLTARVPELLAFGMNDRRLEHLPDLYAQLMQDTDTLMIGLESGLSQSEYQRLIEWQPRFAESCQELADYGLPDTLVHEEVHENNVLVQDGRYTFTDWSDSSVAHPFFSIIVTVRSIAHWLKLDENGPELMRVRDAYLEPWTKYDTRARLSKALDLAYRLGMVNRALSWHHGTASLSEKHKAAYADNVPGWMQDYLNAETEQSNPETQ